jgi:hypothetical protein
MMLIQIGIVNKIGMRNWHGSGADESCLPSSMAKHYHLHDG